MRGKIGFYEKSIKETFNVLNSGTDGLKDIRALQDQYGLNEIARGKKKEPWKIFLVQFHSFIIYILFGAALISGALGEWVDTIVIMIILILNALMGFIQEYKAEKSIEALKRLASDKAIVIRAGKEQTILARELVPGDIIVLETGAKVPADARLIESINLHSQEAALTGESLPVAKTTNVLKAGLTLGDQTNMVFSSTIIVQGRGKAIVTATGMNTEIGKIAGLIQQTKTESTPLQNKLNALGKKLGLITIIITVVVFLTGVLRGGAVLRMLLDAVALAVAAVPEGLPAVVTIALGIGVQKMIKKNALIRKLPAVETLGAVTVICTDKTGTLTHNQMTVVQLYSAKTTANVTGSGYAAEGKIQGKFEKLLVEIGVLCNDAKLVKDGIIGDPTEACLLTVARKAGINEDEFRQKYPRTGEIAFDSTRKMMTTTHVVARKTVHYTKGAPDIIIERCTKILIDGKEQALTPKERKAILDQNTKFSQQALRVLAFAYSTTAEKDMVFVGLQAMIDPPREEVKSAIAKCASAGIKVVMITGDHLVTAQAIASQLGIEGRAVLGSDLDTINLDKEVEHIGVYARVNPEHKLRIVTAFQAKGHIVAMTGDGVNDAPALKKADIGIAMGITGTDVSKEASSMILTDDNFTSIVSAVEEGRNIYDNIKKFVNYLLSSNVGEVLLLFIAMIIGFSYGGVPVLPLIAIQILWVNLVTDGLPALALGVDPADPHIMERKPRKPKESIISKSMAWNIGVIGVLMTVGVLFIFAHYLPGGIEKAQTMALTLLVVFEIVRLEMIRGQYHTPFFANKWLTIALAGVLLLQLAIIYTPLSTIFGLATLNLVDWVWIVIMAAAMMVIGKVASVMIHHATKQDD